jgi:glycosyltransferase involved in cell wall biosynthesis
VRVLMVSPNYLPVIGGVETHVAEVAPRLARAGVDVEILTTDRSAGLPRREVIGGLRVRRVPAYPPGADYYLAPGVLKAVARGRWDIVHCQGVHTFVPPLAMLAAAQRRTPFVVTFHTGGHSSVIRDRLRTLQWVALVPLLRKAARLIAVSRFEAGLFARLPGLDEGRIEVIPNGADGPAEVGPAPAVDPDLIVSVGRLERYKGHHRAIAALPGLSRHRPGIRLRIAGSGPFEAELRRIAARLGVAERVEIAPVPAGDRAAMLGLLASAAVVVLLSEYESQGLAAMDALAIGRPVVATDATAFHELAVRGLVRPVGRTACSAEIVFAILAALEAPAPPPILLSTWDDCARALLKVYRSIAGEATAGA